MIAQLQLPGRTCDLPSEQNPRLSKSCQTFVSAIPEADFLSTVPVWRIILTTSCSQHLHSVHLKIWGLASSMAEAAALLGRLGISGEGHGSLAAEHPVWLLRCCWHPVRDSWGEGGGQEDRAAELRQEEEQAVGDYRSAKHTVGRPRWSGGLAEKPTTKGLGAHM